MNTLLIAEHLFAGKHERSALRSENDSLRQLGGRKHVLLRLALHRFMKFISEAKVVVARDIIHNHLRRRGIREFGIIAILEIHLRMRSGSHDTDLDSLLQSRLAGGEAAIGGIRVMSLHSIAKIIREYSYILHLAYILLQRATLNSKRGVSGSPSLAINEDRGVDLFKLSSDIVHCLSVMNRHEVETETVDMIFICPIFH